MLLITAIIDYEHRDIMDAVLLLFSSFMILHIIFAKVSVADHLLGSVIRFCAYLMVYLLSRLAYRKEAFGFGDVLLMGATGLFLGKNKVIVAAIMSFYLHCGIYYIDFWRSNKSRTMYPRSS